MSKSYTKRPDRMFRLTRDVVVPAGTMFSRAPDERGGSASMEGLVGLGRDATAWIALPTYMVEIDAKDWFDEVIDVREITDTAGDGPG